ncbi:MAG: type 1 glutamine amidotransferase [Acidimicrobiia bacterium]|nr:type 1 glutamine amidotransferase [Acidimicrobiia bacterium]
MARIAVLIEEDFEDSEYRLPRERLEAAGHDVVVAGPTAGSIYTGKRGDEKVAAEVATDSLAADEFDAVVVPGGYAPDKLRLDEDAVAFVREMNAEDKVVAAVCHAGSLLIDADAVDGRTVTSWPSIRVDLLNAGATWVDEEVVEDGNVITSRKPDDLEAFAASIAARLAGSS